MGAIEAMLLVGAVTVLLLVGFGVFWARVAVIAFMKIGHVINA